MKDISRPLLTSGVSSFLLCVDTTLCFFLHSTLSSGKTSGVDRASARRYVLGREDEQIIIDAKKGGMSIFQLRPLVRAVFDSGRLFCHG
jgi:hypothetical protein